MGPADDGDEEDCLSKGKVPDSQAVPLKLLPIRIRANLSVTKLLPNLFSLSQTVGIKYLLIGLNTSRGRREKCEQITSSVGGEFRRGG